MNRAARPARGRWPLKEKGVGTDSCAPGAAEPPGRAGAALTSGTRSLRRSLGPGPGRSKEGGELRAGIGRPSASARADWLAGF